ncbi:M48 family metalloprotease [Uliginosibacterium gangwonense]|uniref:M48 family metalloprotease n=1 Tax=Uliginosibacterium gangwonense TaxID=392736 RepID=UPI000363CE0A|nr:M48 family metalloprotease [Uliginosibacterium gangwonense]
MAVVPIRFPISRTEDSGNGPRLRLAPEKRQAWHPERQTDQVWLSPKKIARWLIIPLLALIWMTGSLLRPPLVQELAELLPATWIKAAAIQAQTRLDNSLLGPSLASPERTEQLAARFAALEAPVGGAPPYRLTFRNANPGVALVYALPEGSIVVTDELLQALPDDTHVLALLCQQLGHLRYQHMLQSAVADEMLVVSIAMLAGQEKWAAPRLARSFLATIDSAQNQLEADRFAQAMLAQNHISPSALNAAQSYLSVSPALETQPLLEKLRSRPSITN